MPEEEGWQVWLSRVQHDPMLSSFLPRAQFPSVYSGLFSPSLFRRTVNLMEREPCRTEDGVLVPL